MELLVLLVSGGVIIGLVRIAGLIRAVSRQPVEDRLKAYCQRR